MEGNEDGGNEGVLRTLRPLERGTESKRNVCDTGVRSSLELREAKLSESRNMRDLSVRTDRSLDFDKEGEKAERSGVLGEENTLPASLLESLAMVSRLLDDLLRSPETVEVNDRFDWIDAGRDVFTWKLDEGRR